MNILLNGDKETLDKDYNLTELLLKYEFTPEIVTVNVNGEIIKREDFENTIVKDGDSVDILMFMGGGQ